MAGTETESAMETSSIENTNYQASEVAVVKSAFPNRCRVMSDIGGYHCVVTVQPENYDVTIKFQLSVVYPSAVPEIVIRSESLTTENIEGLQKLLMKKAESLLGGPMIQNLICDAEKELQTLGLRPGKTSIVNSHKYIGKNVQKPKKQKRKPKSEDENMENKLPPMKTSDDVVKRIIWDQNLEKDDFIVGYIDRFRGLVEKYFFAFSWDDLASVDYDVLAVPKHRIQYFKYKDIKVWDKMKRIDNVFGSANGTKTIDVVIREVNEAATCKNEDKDTQASTVERASPLENSQSDEYSTSDDDDDDGITVTIGSMAGIQSKAEDNDDVAAEKEKGSFNSYWEDKLRPNYFLCVRITNTEITDHIGKIQDRLLETEPLFGECCIPGVSLHITLCTLGLDTSDQLLHCIETLNKIKPELEDSLPKSTLNLQGLSDFYNRVIYAKVHYQEDFISFYNLLKVLLNEAGVQIRDGYNFVPHVTILKTTRPVSRLRGSKNIHPKMYQEFLEDKFGEQKMTGIHLCSMAPERREDGFYLTPLELHFKDQ